MNLLEAPAAASTRQLSAQNKVPEMSVTIQMRVLVMLMWIDIQIDLCHQEVHKKNSGSRIEISQTIGILWLSCSHLR